MVGKYLNGYGVQLANGPTCESRWYQAQGWDEWHALVGNGQLMLGWTINDNAVYPDETGFHSSSTIYQTDALTTRATAFIDAAVGVGRPFFLYVAPGAPHTEHTEETEECVDNTGPPEEHTIRSREPYDGSADGIDLPTVAPFNDDSSDKPLHVSTIDAPYLPPPYEDNPDYRCTQQIYRDRLEALDALDDMVGAIADEVASHMEFANNTIIFFTADNGFLQGEYRIHGKRLPYEESIRVPLAVRYVTSEGPAGQANIVDAVVLNTDLTRTIADLTGLCDPAYPNDPCVELYGGMSLEMDGQSFARFLPDPDVSPPATWRKRFLVEHWTGDQDPSYPDPGPIYPTFSGIRTGPTDIEALRNRLYVEHQLLDGWSAAFEYYDNLDQYLTGGAPEIQNDYTSGCCTALKEYLDRLVDCEASPETGEDTCQSVENEVSS